MAAPVIDALRPDVVVSAAFPRLIPAEILEIPKYGAINCHPSPLPAGRGPTPQRLIYEGDERVGATVHRTAAEFDTARSSPSGSRRSRTTSTALGSCRSGASAQPVPGRGCAPPGRRHPGVPQDPAAASEAPLFTEEELLLDLTEPAAVVRRKAAALNVTSPQAQVRLARYDVRRHPDRRRTGRVGQHGRARRRPRRTRGRLDRPDRRPTPPPHPGAGPEKQKDPGWSRGPSGAGFEVRPRPAPR